MLGRDDWYSRRHPQSSNAREPDPHNKQRAWHQENSKQTMWWVMKDVVMIVTRYACCVLSECEVVVLVAWQMLMMLFVCLSDCVFTCRVRLHVCCCSNKHRKETPTDTHTHSNTQPTLQTNTNELTEHIMNLNHDTNTTHQIMMSYNELTTTCSRNLLNQRSAGINIELKTNLHPRSRNGTCTNMFIHTLKNTEKI